MRSLLTLLLMAIMTLSVSAQSTETYILTSATSEKVGESYLAAYNRFELGPTCPPLLTDDSSFADPTAELVFGGVRQNGKETMMRNFRKNYASIAMMEFYRTRAVFSGNYAIFEGSLDWTINLKGGKQMAIKSMPILLILRIENGLVVEHRDYADYGPYLVASQNLNAGNCR